MTTDTEYPLFVLSLTFLVGLIMVVDDGSKSEYAETGQLLMKISWFAFLIDHIVRFTLSVDRIKFVTHNIIEASRYWFLRCESCCWVASLRR